MKLIGRIRSSPVYLYLSLRIELTPLFFIYILHFPHFDPNDINEDWLKIIVFQVAVSIQYLQYAYISCCGTYFSTSICLIGKSTTLESYICLGDTTSRWRWVSTCPIASHSSQAFYKISFRFRSQLQSCWSPVCGATKFGSSTSRTISTPVMWLNFSSTFPL